MSNYTEEDIQKYLKFVDENMIELEEIQGQCHICGKLLKDLELPNGPENKVVCLKDVDSFEESYQEMLDFYDIN